MDVPVLLVVLQEGTFFIPGIVAVVEQDQQRKRPKTEHRTLPRSKRRVFRHGEAMSGIQRDYLGKKEDPTTPLFGAEFGWMFRVSKGRFQVLMEDIMGSQHSFFKPSLQDGHERYSVEARLLLPLKTFAYGVPSHTFIDYFQMSPQYARDCCKYFANVVKNLHSNEFLRCPTKQDIKIL
jgi:hypothetical protein